MYGRTDVALLFLQFSDGRTSLRFSILLSVLILLIWSIWNLGHFPWKQAQTTRCALTSTLSTRPLR